MPRPLVVTADPDLLDALLRLVAAGGGEADVAPDAVGARSSWPAAPLVLLGDDQSEAAVAAGLPRRHDLVLVSAHLDDAGIWRRAVALGAEHVAFLPDAEPWLVGRVQEAVADPGTRARVVGVIGGRGGAGATTTAVALAIAALRAGRATLLVDADALGGGIDLVLGGEDDDGPRWPDLAAARVPPGDLVSALPRMRELTVLSWDRDGGDAIPPDRLHAVLSAARRGAELVVVDLPRSFDPVAREALGFVDLLLVVVPAEVRACAAARRVVARAGVQVGDRRVVVRGPSPSGLTAEAVAEAVGAPLAGYVRSEPAVVTALEAGDPPGRRGRGPLAAFARRFVDELFDG